MISTEFIPYLTSFYTKKDLKRRDGDAKDVVAGRALWHEKMVAGYNITSTSRNSSFTKINDGR